jgi:hypothetical protein
MTSYPSDSGYEPHHPSLDSQISETSHISVSTPVQATDSGDDLHPLLRTISQDQGKSCQLQDCELGLLCLMNEMTFKKKNKKTLILVIHRHLSSVHMNIYIFSI